MEPLRRAVYHKGTVVATYIIWYGRTVVRSAGLP